MNQSLYVIHQGLTYSSASRSNGSIGFGLDSHAWHCKGAIELPRRRELLVVYGRIGVAVRVVPGLAWCCFGGSRAGNRSVIIVFIILVIAGTWRSGKVGDFGLEKLGFPFLDISLSWRVCLVSSLLAEWSGRSHPFRTPRNLRRHSQLPRR